MNRVELKEWSKKKINNNLLNIWKGIGVAFIISAAISMIGSLLGIVLGEDNKIVEFASVILEIISFPVSVGLYAYLMKFVRSGKFDITLIFDYFSDIVKISATLILESILIFSGCLIFIVPGIYLAFSYALVPYLLAERKDLSMTEILRLSRKMMNGKKLDYFVLVFSFIGLEILSIFTFGILLIWLVPYVQIATTKFLTDTIDNYEE